MTDSKAPNSAFNARDLDAKEISDRFIVSPEFDSLLDGANCVLEGPRGSGKTTLLRMLTPEVFTRWSTANEQRSIPFIGIFVPADVRWAKQLELRLERAHPEVRTVVEQAAFSVAVNLALINTIEQCSRLESTYGTSHPDLTFAVDRKTEGSIAKSCARLWQIDIDLPSFNATKFALRERLQKFGQLALTLGPDDQVSELVRQHLYMGNTWLENIVPAIETINEIIGRPNQLWAVLLDELEIIPEGLLKTIVQAFRSTSSRIRFKMALSPSGSQLIATGEDGAPTPGNDYRDIPLWYSDPKEARLFSERLLTSALIESGCLGHDEDLRIALTVRNGSSDLQDIDDTDDIEGETDQLMLGLDDDDAKLSDSADRYRAGIFTSLYNKDESFKALLDEKNIDPANPPYKDGLEYGTFVRKISPIVLFRDREIDKYTIKGGVTKKGARRGLGPYTGFQRLLDLAEGNPRWILTLADELTRASRGKGLPISSPGVQTTAVSNFSQTYIAKLKVYPVSSTQMSAYDFVSLLGSHLRRSLYEGQFTSDPSLSFEIDDWSFSRYGKYIRLCVDLGGLIIMRKEPTAGLASGSEGQSLLGNRVRICYRLAPEFRLPLKAIKEQRMSTALKLGQQKETPQGLPVQEQLSL